MLNQNIEIEDTHDQLIIEGGPMANGQKVVVKKMKLNQIKLGKNSRLLVSKEELAGLMQSIKEVGLLQPVGVVKNGSGYEICYGNRRFMACSKLGFTHIPVIVHEKKKESDIDIKNLTENIQRRNISLGEAGRYVELLKAEGLTSAEIAVRLGVSASYVDDCVRAFHDVPKEFRDDLETNLNRNAKNKKQMAGKISISEARAIINAKKTFRLSAAETKKLFQAAKSDDKFRMENVKEYAKAIRSGKSDFTKSVKALKQINIRVLMSEDDFYELQKKYVDNGPFRSVTALTVAILRGEKAVKLDVRAN